jgi:putative ABC transport system permease protein
MLAHYAAVALAKIRKTPFTTGASVLTLALGLACFIAAYGIAQWWRSGDTYHANADRTFVVGQSSTPAGQAEPNATQTQSSVALGKYLATEFSGIESVARVYIKEKAPVAAGSTAVLLEGAFAEPAFLDIFDFDFLAGDARSALDAPGSVVLTRDAAARLFGDAPALGQRLLIDNAHEATVTGVIAPVRQPSFMGASADAQVRFDMLGRWDVLPAGPQMDEAADRLWRITGVWTFVTLTPGASVDALNAQLPAFVERHVPAELRAVSDVRNTAFPVSEMTRRTLDNTLFPRSTLGLTAAAALLGLGALTLLVASINYANLATAQAAVRGREIGLRRTLGAGRAQIMLQTWAEAGLLTLLATLLALLALALAAPAVRAQTGIDLLHFLSQGAAPLIVLAALVVVVAFVAGAYPALVLSGLRPIAVMRPSRSHSGPKGVARILVGVQFATASFLLIVLTVAQLQRVHLEREALNAARDPVVVLNEILTIGVDYDLLMGALAGQPGVVSASLVDHAPWSDGAATWPLARSPDASANATTAILKLVADDYFDTISQDVLAGRVFARERETASSPQFFSGDSLPPIVIDRAYATALGYASPAAAVDDIVYVPQSFLSLRGGTAARPVRIIGVVETDMARVNDFDAQGSMYVYTTEVTFSDGQYPLVRLARDNVAAGLQSIERVWQDLAPNIAVDIQFTDQLFERAYRQHAQIGQIFVLLVSTAFAIASIGQLGIAVHVVSRRRHEIGVRKVLGSSSLGVARLLLLDFSKPALVANLLAWPAGYLAAQTYLSAFAHRVELTPAPFALSLAITLAIAWAAVIGEVLKAASVRPAEVLRHA